MSDAAAALILGPLHPTVTVDGQGEGRASFAPIPELRGNPGWLHGGLAATVLDHVCARTASAALGGSKVVTGRLDLRYRQPVPLDRGPYEVVARPKRVGSRMVTLHGAIVGPDGSELVGADAMFVRLDR